MVAKCRNCSEENLTEIINLGNMPIAHRMLLSPEDQEKLYPLAIHFCQSCGLTQLCDPIDAKTLYVDFNYCFTSWKPQKHMHEEIDIILNHDESGKIFEIACNDGQFLEELRKKGAKMLVGLEPNSVAVKLARDKGFDVYEEMLTENICKKAVEKYGKFNTVVSRQTLEHLPDLDNFFKCADILLKEGGFLFVDVPEITNFIEEGDITFIWEEHTNYFRKEVLLSIFKKFGYEPIWVKLYNYSGGIIAIQAQRTKPTLVNSFEDTEFSDKLINFEKKTTEYRNTLKETLTRYREKGSKIVLYGVGCRACTLVNGYKLKNYIDFAIDDQKERQNKFMAGSRLQVLSPDEVNKTQDSFLILLAVNQENESKVKERLKKITKNRIDFISVCSPNSILDELK